MNFAIILVLLIIVGAFVATISLTGKSDENYSGEHKVNTVRLTAIYTVVILVSLAVLGWYITTL